jgi:asparagine synthase (glutamine-hydrolysing)
MCGICGIVSLRAEPVRGVELLAMSRAIEHRGPDDEGFALINSRSGKSWYYAGSRTTPEIRHIRPTFEPERHPSANIGLGHGRFSIIDLSAAGHQPFISSDESCCVVFNGEIYNYLELREELVRSGVSFRSKSDTEVLVESYKLWGVECFKRFNGFWAVALYDFAKRQLLLSRDRIGKKPLFWARFGDSIYFASEIKALLRVKSVSEQAKVDERSAFIWLAYGKKDIGNITSFEGVYSLPAGTWTFIDQDFPNRLIRFWDLPCKRIKESDISIQEASTHLRRLLEDAVRIRLRADVPVAVELSGGLDSSTLVALAATVSKRQVQTFTVRFPEKQWNEEPFARSLADRFDVGYNVLDSPIDRFWNNITAFTWLEEEPYHAPNLQTNQEVWGVMREQGMKVSLNGAGGDELLGGYRHHFAPAQLELLSQGNFSCFICNLMKHKESSNIFQSGWRIAFSALRRLSQSVPHLTAFRSRLWFRHLQFQSHFPNPVQSNLLSDFLYNDMTNMLMPYWLRSGDRGYMGVPLEVRAPFLDYRVVEFAFRLPISYLVRNGWHKWILRKAMEDILPTDVAWRRNKMGFPFDFDRFYRKSRAILELIFREADNPYVNKRLLGSFTCDWRVISFLLWYELFFNKNSDLFRRIEALAEVSSPASLTVNRPEFARRPVSLVVV